MIRSTRMSKVILLFVLVISVIELSSQASLPSDPFYVAGVVEFARTDLEENLDGYLKILGSSEASETDIIVFPEMTLNDGNDDEATLVPDPNITTIIPCDDDPNANVYHKLLVDLSCQAKNISKYVVINVVEKEKCPAHPEDTRQCGENNYNKFNTNVVFDRNGAVISRYRKVHLFGEESNTTYLPEFGTFETDFGVKFGHFICFDILFYKPAQELVEKWGIHDFIFPTMWYSQLPFLTGVQFQHSWAFGNDVNLLAAGASEPQLGSTGTGIFNGRHGSLVSVMKHNIGERHLYLARVPKYTNEKRRSRRSSVQIDETHLRQSDVSLNLKRDYLEHYEHVLVNLTNGNSLQQKICHRSFCCDFDLSWNNITDLTPDSQIYTYRLGVYNGTRKENETDAVETNFIRNCAIFTCTASDSIMECGKLFTPSNDTISQPQVIFTRIAIQAMYPRSKEFLLMPNSLTEDLLPLEPNQFVWQSTLQGNYYNVSFASNETISNLLTFAIYGNYFDDIETVTGNNSSFSTCSLGLIIVATLISLLLNVTE